MVRVGSGVTVSKSQALIGGGSIGNNDCGGGWGGGRWTVPTDYWSAVTKRFSVSLLGKSAMY